MLVEAALLTAVGMTTVFGFLGLLVCLMHLSARLVERFPGPPEARLEVSGAPETLGQEEAQIAAVLAIVAAQRGEG